MGRWQKTIEKAVSTPKQLTLLNPLSSVIMLCDHEFWSWECEKVKFNLVHRSVWTEWKFNGSVWTEHAVKFFRRVENSLGTMWRQP